MNSPPYTFFERLVSKLLHPLISILIRNNLHYRRFCELVKDAYVDVAVAQFGQNGRPTNTTRVALLTGIDRKEVKRIRERDIEVLANKAPTQTGSLARILTAWHQDPQFSLDGQPQPLEITDGFAQLCKQYGGDITRTAILKELRRVGAISSLQNGDVIAKKRYYMPEQSDTEAIARSLDVYQDIGSTLVNNLYRQDRQASRFEGRASNSQVPVQYVEDFRHFIETEGQRFLEAVDNELSNYEQQNLSNQPTVRLGLGLYWIENNAERQ